MSVVVVRMLPDKSGRARVCWFCRTADGPITTPKGVVMSNLGPVMLGGVRGKIACQPTRKDVSPTLIRGEYHTCVHSDDIRAVTCPDCLMTADARAALASYGEMLDSPTPAAFHRDDVPVPDMSVDASSGRVPGTVTVKRGGPSQQL